MEYSFFIDEKVTEQATKIEWDISLFLQKETLLCFNIFIFGSINHYPPLLERELLRIPLVFFVQICFFFH